MEIETVIQKKHELDTAITDLIMKFQGETGVQVARVEVQRLDASTMGGLYHEWLTRAQTEIRIR